MLTPEREALLRELRYEDGSAVMVSYQDARNLIAEIDALRAKVAALEEAGDGLADALQISLGGVVDLAFEEGQAIARWREVRGV